MSNINKADLIKSADFLKKKNEIIKEVKENIFIEIPRLGKKFEFKEPSKVVVDELIESNEKNKKLKLEEAVCDVFLESCIFNFNDKELKESLSESLNKKIITEQDSLRHVLVFEEIDAIVGKILEHYGYTEEVS